LAVVSPVDLLEWLCSNHKIWTLRLQCQDAEGEVVVVGGQLTDASWGHARGMEALSIIVGCHSGFFELVPVSGSTERTLDGPWQSLLLRAVQILDERNHENRRARKDDSVTRKLPFADVTRGAEHPLIALPALENSQASTQADLDPAAPAEVPEEATVKTVLVSAEELIDQGFAALRAGDTTEARRCWTAALAMVPDNRTLRFNLRKLDQAAQTQTER
jgi:Domain of unknown function (DUF4388)